MISGDNFSVRSLSPLPLQAYKIDATAAGEESGINGFHSSLLRFPPVLLDSICNYIERRALSSIRIN